MSIRRWQTLTGSGFAIAAISAAVLVGSPCALADPSADPGASTSSDTAAEPSGAAAAPGKDTEQPTGSAGSEPDTAEAADTPDVDETEPSSADPPEEAEDDPDSPTLTEERRATKDEARASDPRPAAATEVEVADDSERETIRDVAPTEEQVEPVDGDADIATKPAATTTRTVAVRTESVPSEPDSEQEAVAAPIATAVDAVAVGARQPSLLTVVGSLVMNLLMGLIHLVDGAPVVPPGSTVTVRTSSLTLPVGTGEEVQADWYFPEVVDDSTHLVYLQHGFMASGPMYSYTAAHLAERTNSIVVVPSLSSNFFDPNADWVGGSTMQKAVAKLFEGQRTALTESASAAWGSVIELPETFALVGHSAGGTLVTAVAGYLADDDALDDLVGIVMLDGVEPKGSHAVNDALAKLTGEHYRPIQLISSQRYMWNRGGDMADKLMAARPDDFNGVALTGGTHIDYMEGGNGLLQFAEYLISGFSLRENVDAAGIITAGWVNDLFGGTANGVYGTPGQSISIATPSKPATAVVLPLGPAGPSPLGEYLDTLLHNVLEYAGEHLFVYEPLT